MLRAHGHLRLFWRNEMNLVERDRLGPLGEIAQNEYCGGGVVVVCVWGPLGGVIQLVSGVVSIWLGTHPMRDQIILQ